MASSTSHKGILGLGLGVDLLKEAARGGHVQAMRWLRDRGCPWGGIVPAYAAGEGRLEALQRLRAQGCPWGAYTPAFAEIGGFPEVKAWALQNGCDYSAELTLRLRIAEQMARYAHP